MSNFVQEVQQSILTQGLFSKAQSILVAVSGGLDSIVLLHLLHRLSVRQEWELTVAHFNHQLRGRASDGDEQFVRKTADRLKLPCAVGRADVKQFGREHKLSVEMAARQLRHDFLARAAREKGIHSIALAHHADDQLELFFVRLFRGTGPEGLAGMKWQNRSPSDPSITLVRPLLGCSREAIDHFARQEKIVFREDATNASLDILRNRVRHELLPLLRKHYQPALARTVSRLRTMLESESEVVGRAAANWLKRKRRAPFDRLPVAVQRRVLQQQLIQSGVKLDFELVEKLRTAVDIPVTINANLGLSRDGGGQIRARQTGQPEFNSNRVWLDLGAGEGSAQFDDIELSWKIERGRAGGVSRPRSAPGREYFDADKVGSAMVLRHWQRGDRFQPIGMPASVKLQDLFSNQQIPRARRHQLTVATTAEGELVWVEGLRISDRFKLDKGTVRALKWNWRRSA